MIVGGTDELALPHHHKIHFHLEVIWAHYISFPDQLSLLQLGDKGLIYNNLRYATLNTWNTFPWHPIWGQWWCCPRCFLFQSPTHSSWKPESSCFLLQISFWFHSLVIAFGHIQNPFSRPKTYVLCVGFVASCCFEFTVLAVSITEPMAHIAIYALSLKYTVLQIFSFRHEWDGCQDLNNCSTAAAFVQWMDCYSFTFYIHVWRYIQAPQRWEWSLMFRDLVYFPYSCLGTCLDLLFSEVM